MLAVFGLSPAPALPCGSSLSGVSSQVIMLVFMHHVPVFTRVCVTHLGFGLVPGYLALLVLGRLA